jgi:hypothetical protein
MGSFSALRRKSGNQNCHGTCHGHATQRNRGHGAPTQISRNFMTLALEVLKYLSRKTRHLQGDDYCNSLIYNGFWWLWVDSNHRPRHYE